DGRAAEEAFALMAELQQREESLKLREAQLAQSVAARQEQTQDAAAREQLVARGEQNLSTLREELDRRAERTDKLEQELAQRAGALEEQSDELRLREARLGAGLQLPAQQPHRPHHTPPAPHRLL